MKIVTTSTEHVRMLKCKQLKIHTPKNEQWFSLGANTFTANIFSLYLIIVP